MIAPTTMHVRLAVRGLLLTLVCLPALAAPPGKSDDPYADARNRMVDEEIYAAGVKDSRVIDAMRKTPRHEFTLPSAKANAYFDMALPIGEGQTISPPFVVAYMTEQLAPKAEDKVLEIGTGSGYQAAVLSPLAKEVYSIEIVKPLGERAERTLKRLKYNNVHVKIGDGYQGWPEHAPFDKIIVTCSPEKVPPKLVEQLRDGGRMIVPVGERYQQTLYLFEKKGDKLTSVALLPTLFVPMTGAAEQGRVVLPKPENPTIINGGFEETLFETMGDKRVEKPSGWHYQRQLDLASDHPPQGKHYAEFTNQQPGRGSQALQGMAVDGRKVSELEVSLSVRADDIEPGQGTDEHAMLAITFYDKSRAMAGSAMIGPWRGSFSWKKETERIKVPSHAREAIVRIGLNGATGQLALDDIQIKAVRKR